MKNHLKRFLNIYTLGGTISVFLVIGFFVLIPVSLDAFDPLVSAYKDFELTDIYYSQLVNTDQIITDTNIVLINIDNFTDRRDISNLIEKIQRFEPKVVGLDILFRELRDSVIDLQLSREFSKWDNIVIVNKLYDTNSDNIFDTVQNSIPLFSAHTKNAYADLIVDNDRGYRTIRDFLPFYRTEQDTFSAFTTQIVSMFNPEAFNRLRDRENPVEIINYIGNERSFINLNIGDVLDSSNTEFSFLKNKIILLGFLSLNSKCEQESFDDYFFTPLNKRYAGKSFPDLRGVVIHANIISLILRGDYIVILNYTVNLILQILFVFLNMIFFYYVEKKLKVLYDIVTKVVQVIESVFIVLIQLLFFSLFSFNFEISIALLGLILSADVYEAYASVIYKIKDRTK